jgi:hypothetical protein
MSFMVWASNYRLGCAVGQDLLWDFSYPSSVTKNSTPTNDNTGNIFNGMALIIAIVTGFYLVMLHQALDHARKSGSEIKEIQENIGIMISDINREKQLLKDQANVEIQLRREILLPLLRMLELPPPYPVLVQNNLQTKQDILKAEISLFELHKTKGLDEFKNGWNDIDAFMTIFNEHPKLFRFHFERVQRTLEELCLSSVCLSRQ